MSTQRKANFVEEAVSAQTIHDFLAANPDFFERHPTLLAGLSLPHGPGGSVSLIERQVSMLRQKEFRLERKLKDLIEVARNNEVLAAKVHELSLQLLRARDLQATIAVVEQAMREGFAADNAVLVLLADPGLFANVRASRFFRAIDRRDESLKPFATFLESGNARCGQIRDAQREFLFRSASSEVGSVALVPLGRKADLGFLAIGSADTDRFHPGMSMDFLTRIGDLVAEALRRF